MTPKNNVELSPVEQTSRIYSLDVIRGIALLGILFINIIFFGLPDAHYNLVNSMGLSDWNLRIWFISDMFFEGTFRGLFSMLFGAGFILLVNRGINKGGGIEVADVYYRRMLCLLFFGVIHLYVMLWEWDILFPFAVFGLMLFPFRNTKPKYLLIAGLVLLSVVSVKSVYDYKKDLKIKTDALAVEKLKETNHGALLKEAQDNDLASWDVLKRGKSKEQIKAKTEKHLQGYLSIVKSRFKNNVYIQSTLVYIHWVWDVLSFMLIGIAFFKWQIFQGGRSRRFYFFMVIIGYTIGLGVNYYETMTQINSGFDTLGMSKVKQTYQLGRLFTTVGHIGLFMLFIKSGFLRSLQNALAAVGKMALTNYLMQTVICNTIFLGFGFGMYGKFQRYELCCIVLAIWIIQLIYSSIWLKYFKYGPVEWVWRSVSYMKKQPFRNDLP